MLQQRSRERNKTHKNEGLKLGKETVKLPYLHPNKPMQPYNQRLTLHGRPHQPQFDLHTNHAVMPRYQASNDNNLVYFFSKPTNKKIIDQLNLQQTSAKQKASNTQRLHQSRSLQNTKEVRVISKLDFDKYLTKMKARVLSESTK